jgi:transitional endoplasmic reticulum ATPase
MSYLSDKRKEHEEACAGAIRHKDYSRAKFHAAKTAEFSLKLAEQTEGQVAKHYVKDAFEWIEIGEELAIRTIELSPKKVKKISKIADEVEESEYQAEWLVTEKPKVSLDDIAGMEDVKQLIQDMILAPLCNPETATKWGVNKGGGILMFGPPGNGKTTLAKAIAHELDCPFYFATGADIRSKWSGEAEKRLRQLIHEAKSNPVSVLFIDDLDGLLPRRGGYSVVDNRVVCQFLAEIGGFEPEENILLLLGATNAPWNIDEAVFRTGRFDEKIFVGLPDAAAREQILRAYVKDVPLSSEVNLSAVAADLDGYTGSDIVGIASSCKRAGFHREVSGQGLAEVLPSDIEGAVARIPKSVTPQLMKKYHDFNVKRF